MTDIKKLPKELTEKREITECNFIFSCYLDPSILSEYNNIKNEEDIITEAGKTYYDILTGMVNMGFQEITNMSIYDYLSDKTKLRDKFENMGGWQTVKDILALVSLNNISVYYEELIKNNFLIKLHERGFSVIDNLDMFKDMTAEEVYAYYDYQLSNIALGKIEKVKSEDLSSGYEEYIEDWDQGNDVGFPIGSKMLNYQLLGIHKKNLLLHLGSIGAGKTTTAISWYILPNIKAGNSIVVIANEQGVAEWRQMLLSTVLFNEIGFPKGLDRHKFHVGKFTEEQKEYMYKAADWLKAQPGKVIFIETEDYDTKAVKKIMTQYSKLGIEIFLLDTAKPMDEASDKAWAEFSEVMKGIFLQAKKLNVAMIATAQMTYDAVSRKYLDLSCIGKSKGIAQTATSVVMFRHLSDNEKEKVEGFNYEGKIKKIVTLDKNKSYTEIFIPKNRWGSTSPQIIMESNMGFNLYKDVCWHNCEYDSFKTR